MKFALNILLGTCILIFSLYYVSVSERQDESSTSKNMLSLDECRCNSDTTSYKERPPTLWISQILFFAFLNFTPSGVRGNDLCTKHGLIYREGIHTQKLWAVQMLDASGLSPSGLLSGNNHNFGHFDQCIRVEVPEYKIMGKYIVARISFSPVRYSEFYTDVSQVYQVPRSWSSVWSALKETQDLRIKKRNAVNYAMCVPSSCTEEDVKASLEHAMLPVLETNFLTGNISVLTNYTYSRQNYKINNSTDYYFFIFISFALVFAVTVATIYDVFISREPNMNSKKRAWLYHFSAAKNMEKLLKPKNDEFSAISGMKVISMFLIIYGHRMMMSFFSPMHNSLDVEMAIGEFINIYFYNGIVIVNTFLVITGFLTYYKALNDISHNTKISIIQYVYRRWMRLTPAYLYVMTFVLNVVPYIEQGPLGRNVIWDYSPCYKYLWTHLLFINNYVHVENQCLIPSWYMATDMQLYIICSLLAFFFWKSEKIGKLLLFATAMVFIITPGLVVIKGHYNGVVLLFHRDFHHYFNQNEFIETYLQTHSRASPYLIGMLGAYVYKQLKDKKKTFSKKTILLTTLICSIIMHLSIGMAWVFYIPGRKYITLEHVLYTVLHRIGWSAPICWIIIAHATTGLGIFQNTIGLRIFQPLNQLTYCALLVHTPIQLYLVGLQRGPVYYTHLLSWWMGAADISFSYAAALLLYLLVEAPFAGLQDIMKH